MSYSIGNTLKIVWRFRFPVAIKIKKIKPAALRLPKGQQPVLSNGKGGKKKAKLGRRNHPRTSRRRSLD